jgi:hypothetical protein
VLAGHLASVRFDALAKGPEGHQAAHQGLHTARLRGERGSISAGTPAPGSSTSPPGPSAPPRPPGR